MSIDKTLRDIKSGKGLPPINTSNSGNTSTGLTTEKGRQNTWGTRSGMKVKAKLADGSSFEHSDIKELGLVKEPFEHILVTSNYGKQIIIPAGKVMYVEVD